jgi:hypothetical protein
MWAQQACRKILFEHLFFQVFLLSYISHLNHDLQLIIRRDDTVWALGWTGKHTTSHFTLMRTAVKGS